MTSPRYNSSSSNSALATDVAVATGLSAADVLGRAMVIHDFNGGRIACGIITLAGIFGRGEGEEWTLWKFGSLIF